MNKKIIINNGKYLEDIIEKTINFYNQNEIGLFHKREINNFFIKKIRQNSNIKNYSGCDFIGLYKGKYIVIEAKECKNNIFKISRISKLQKNELELTVKNKGHAFLIIHFNLANKYFIINYEILKKIKTKEIMIKQIQKYGKEIFITFPIILDFIKFID